jgi:radical SAM protein with 4Fe4S-binding SPASM domain
MKIGKYGSVVSIPNSSLWDGTNEKSRSISSFSIELTARCNFDCRHCYIRLHAQEKKALRREMSFEVVNKIADEFVKADALWCSLSGGEPLLREDFLDIYQSLKKKGLLVSILTNGALISSKHIEVFKKYPPRNIEITIYGVTRKTHEKITRVPGSFEMTMNGIRLLKENDIPVRLKTIAMRTNVHELDAIAKYCRENTSDFFRFDPFLHLRYDGDPARNREIIAERLTPEEIVDIEKKDVQRVKSLKKIGARLTRHDCGEKCTHLFLCGAGQKSCSVDPEGNFKLCSSLCQPEFLYDLKKGSVSYAETKFVPTIRDMRSENKNYLENCRQCKLVSLCMWCPANSYLENGTLDSPVKYFCEIAHLRAKELGINTTF